MFTPYTFSGTRVIDAQGSTLVYSDSNAAENGADERISVYADGAHVGTIRPGAMVKLDREASRWELVPLSSVVLLTGTVHVGRGEFHPGTVNGTVTVVDGELARSVQGFQGFAMQRRTSAAGVFPAVALCCFAAGFQAAVRTLQIDGSSGNDIALWTAQVSAEPTYLDRKAIRNKRADLAASSFPVAEGAIYALNDSTTSGATAPDCDPVRFSDWQHWGYLRGSAALTKDTLKAAPIIIPAGYALVVVGTAAATGIYVVAELEAIYG